MATVQVNTAAKFLDDTSVRAPFAGLVTARLKTEGEWISTMPPAPLLVLVELDPMEVRLEAPAHLMGQIPVGTALRLRFPAVGKELVTKVTRVVPAIRAATRSFAVIAELPNPDGSLQPGLFTEAWIGSVPATDFSNAAPALALPEPEPAAAAAAAAPDRRNR